MGHLGWLLLAIIAAYRCALAVPLLVLWSRGRLLTPAGWCSATGCLACPLLIPADLVGLRAAAVFVSAELVFKMVDFLRHRGRGWDGYVAREYCRFLIPFPILASCIPTTSVGWLVRIGLGPTSCESSAARPVSRRGWFS